MLNRRLALASLRRGIRLNSSASEPQRVALKKPTYDIKQIINNLDTVVQTATKRELSQDIIDQISSLKDKSETVRSISFSLNKLLQEKNKLQKEVKSALKEQKDITPLKEQQIELRNKEKEYSQQLKEADQKLNLVLEQVPNGLDPSVAATEQIVNFLNPKDEYRSNSSLEHSKIAVDLGILDLRSASVTSGTSWYYLIGDGALLEQALVQYSLSLARRHGFKMVLPPSIVRNEVADACGFKPRDQNNEEQSYLLRNGDWCLTGTAEIPLAGLGINKVYKEEELPYKVVGLSRSYRAEAGARGKDTRGLFRVHEFTKVELFVWATGEQSSAELEKLRVFQEELITSLGLSAKVVNMPFNDLGAPAYKKYDIEAWMPGRGAFGELTSTSNCTDYQSRRLNTKYKAKDGKNYFIHTLNGTAMAVPRVIVAIIENFYDAATNRIAVPEVLQTYMDDKKFIEKQNNLFL